MLALQDDSLFAAIVDNLSDGIYVLQDDRVVYLNERFAQLFGHGDAGSLLMRDLNDILPHGEGKEIVGRIHAELLAGEPSSVAWGQPFAHMDGTPVWLEMEARRIRLNGRPAILGVCHDRTDCKLIGEAMHISQETFRLVLDAMHDSVYVVGRDYNVIYANRAMRAGAYGDVSSDPCYRICRGCSEPCPDCTLEEVLSSDKPVCREFFDEKRNAWYSTIELAVRIPGMSAPAKLGVRRDITARKEAEQRSRMLSQRLLHAQESERKRLSRELHDDLGQLLNALKIGFDTLAEDLRQPSHDVQDRLWYLSESLNNSIHTIRRLCAGLHPSTLERLGLAETIRQQCTQAANTHSLDIELKCGTMLGVRLESDTEINLYRIFQEALHNVVKHADATRVMVRLVASHPTVRLQIEDNGGGFSMEDYAELSGHHLGLISMAERVELLGGTFQIASLPGLGTAVTVEVPFRKAPPGRTTAAKGRPSLPYPVRGRKSLYVC
ncbi:PAS domain S-box protein [Geobacter sulfurreducens]|uniref:PAS domain-containing sensor histidine kinase n=1 Tax=Geobacter sulfurreducens TaxID=35554 RepID=UPI000DBB916B|nr:PAS domain S-box protein [Geobacter sulfurreducens]BBA71627.1 Signal transduction histidine-protein kinase/phosphatase DegS [Geobacter sulfurreducens]